MPKQSIRTSMLRMRAAMPPERIEALSSAIQGRVLAMPVFSSAAVVALYAPVRNEVSTWELMRAALEAGKTVLFPKVRGIELVFCEVASAADLKPGAFGILEPGDGCREADCGTADLVVVPGVAFDRRGRRIGYGKGFYDRALHRYEKKGRFVGLCYEFQLVQEIPASPHDVEVDLVVTESEAVPAR